MARFPFESLRRDIKENKIGTVSKFTKLKLPKKKEKQADMSLKSKHLLLGRTETERATGRIKKETERCGEAATCYFTVHVNIFSAVLIYKTEN